VSRLDILQPASLFFLRGVLALIFFTHGYPKLTGSGPAMQAFFVQHGLPGSFVYLAGILEVCGGIALAVGVFTRPIALLFSVEMAVAIWKVHSAKGYFAVHEYEFPLALGVVCLVLTSTGAGAFSLDRILFERRSRASRPAKNE
jgi:putative oxidoreductase